jgi:hypothetical protein
MAKKKSEVEETEAFELVCGVDCMIAIDDLDPYENNPRKISSEAVDCVAESIKQFGFEQRIVVWDGTKYGRSKNEIVVGHTRRLAAIQLGLKEVPCTRVDFLTPDEVTKYRIVDNKSGEKSTWDYEKLQLELTSLDLSEQIVQLSFSTIELDTVMQANWEAPSRSDLEGNESDSDPFQIQQDHKIVFSHPQFLTINAAIQKLKEHDQSLSDSEALVEICKNWMNNK